MPDIVKAALGSLLTRCPPQEIIALKTDLSKEKKTMPEQRGSMNVYTCETCRKEFLTILLENGVTPMFMRHNDFELAGSCLGRCVSGMYRLPESVRGKLPEYVWRIPELHQYRLLPRYLQHHVDHGGLILCKAKVEDLNLLSDVLGLQMTEFSPA